jgi:hypothetical protein
VDVGAAFVADAQSAVLMQPGDRALDDPALLAEPGAVRGRLVRDQRSDLLAPQLLARGFALVAAVADDAGGAALGPTAFAAHGRNRLDERDELEAVIAVGGGQ